jgi:hypothetical protein
MTRLMLATLVVVSACQIFDDIKYKPRVGPLQPDAGLPDAPSDATARACPASAPDACGDSNPQVDVSFARQIQPLFMQRCMVHTQMTMMPTVRLDLSTYDSVRKGGIMSMQDIIKPCKPCDSILIQKLSPTPPFGVQMPNGLPPLSDYEITLIRDWIAEGALDN